MLSEGVQIRSDVTKRLIVPEQVTVQSDRDHHLMVEHYWPRKACELVLIFGRIESSIASWSLYGETAL